MYEKKQLFKVLNFLFFHKIGIRAALMESLEHECSIFHFQHVVIGQINPNLYPRNHVKR
jgi:hypothetical protein